ncbi:carbohydrate-binding module family 18 protein [Piromyces sp. E2]|nr:carbohydrate-binding module family 18 protein [Piromyces sp. E2]|eukprot:OUM66064.1 carbohydrate-binding module family 18 protein [Piromyces sp. E2]
MKLYSFIVGAVTLMSVVTALPAVRIDNEDRCGSKYGMCDPGECCSSYGYCGLSDEHCNVSKGCQSKYGECKGEVKAEYKSSKSYGNVKWAGFRYSTYGVKKSFDGIPSADDFDDYVKIMKDDFYEGTTGTILLIVGVESSKENCVFQFPKPTKRYNKKYYEDLDNINFIDSDRYESFLKRCDERGYNVWLQVEPGENDLVQLAHIALDRYGDHPSVKGFGIDCEWWYREYNSEKHGKPLSDREAERVVKAVRERNSSYTVYAKHWKPSYMPPKYRDGMIFVNDSQDFDGSLSRMKKEFKEWAETYPDNPVFFQIGYKRDRSIWEDDPIKVAKAIAESAYKYNKEIGIIWVDFTMKDALKKM